MVVFRVAGAPLTEQPTVRSVECPSVASVAFQGFRKTTARFEGVPSGVSFSVQPFRKLLGSLPIALMVELPVILATLMLSLTDYELEHLTQDALPRSRDEFIS